MGVVVQYILRMIYGGKEDNTSNSLVMERNLLSWKMPGVKIVYVG